MSIFDLQKRIYAALNVSEITSTAKIYDYIPETAPMPFVVIGDDKAEKWQTKTNDGWETTSAIHVWGAEESMKTVKQLLETIEALLSVDLNEFKFHGVNAVSAERYDVEFVHGRIEVKYKVEED